VRLQEKRNEEGLVARWSGAVSVLVAQSRWMGRVPEAWEATEERREDAAAPAPIAGPGAGVGGAVGGPRRYTVLIVGRRAAPNGVERTSAGRSTHPPDLGEI